MCRPAGRRGERVRHCHNGGKRHHPRGLDADDQGFLESPIQIQIHMGISRKKPKDTDESEA